MENDGQESVLDAVNAALGDATADPPPADDPPADDPPADDPPEGGEEGKTGEGAEETDEEAEARGAERNPDGTFKKKGEGEAKPEDKKVDKDGKPVEAKKPDPINDPIPKELKKETQDRIRSLIKTTQEVTTERERVQKDFDFMVQGVQATGATPQQYGETLSWLALFNSGDPAQQAQALELVESVADRLATLLGRERTVGDPLAQHADLKEAVAKGQVTAKWASEIARTRNGQQFRTQLQQSVQQEQTAVQRQQQELASAREGLNAIEASLKQTDPQYDAKREALVPILQPLFKTIPAAQWGQAFQAAYQNLKLPASAAPARRAVPAQQPMRAGKNPAGGQGRAPNSMGEAINAALAGMK